MRFTDEKFVSVMGECVSVKVCVYKKYLYYESIKRELKIKPMYECRCDERLKTKTEEYTRHDDEVDRREVSECDG